MMIPKVIAVSRSSTHSFSKSNESSIALIEGRGVEGDSHLGETVKHRSRVRKNPNTPNLRQVHLIHSELHEELNQQGFEIKPGDMGENITTVGVDILNLPQDTILQLGDETQIQLTGLRYPCVQLDNFQSGLMKALLDKDAEGNLLSKAGVMSIVLKGGVVKPGDTIRVLLPDMPHIKLEKV